MLALDLLDACFFLIIGSVAKMEFGIDAMSPSLVSIIVAFIPIFRASPIMVLYHDFVSHLEGSVSRAYSLRLQNSSRMHASNSYSANRKKGERSVRFCECYFDERLVFGCYLAEIFDLILVNCVVNIGLILGFMSF